MEVTFKQRTKGRDGVIEGIYGGGEGGKERKNSSQKSMC